jgi:hypothetical protein
MMVGAQFWHAYGGGLYIAWFLPLLLLTIFRPNLEDRVALKVIDGGRRLPSIGLVSPWMPRDKTLMNEAYERYRSSLQAIEERRKHLKTGDASWNLVRVILFLAMLVTFGLGYLVAELSVLAILGWIVLFVVSCCRHAASTTA